MQSHLSRILAGCQAGKNLTRSVVMVALATCTSWSMAADGYQPLLIADPTTGLGLPGSGWILSSSTSMNNSGTIVYSASMGAFGGELRTGVFANEGSAMRTIASALRVGTAFGPEVFWGAINNHGEVIYNYSTGAPQDAANLLWVNGTVSKFSIYGSSMYGTFTDSRAFTDTYANQIRIITQGATPSVAVQGEEMFAGTHSISSDGRFVMGSAQGPGTSGLMVSGLGEVFLGTTADTSTPLALITRINNLGLGVFTSDRPGSLDNPGGNLLGLVDAKGQQGGMRTLLDSSAGFLQFGAGQSGLAINNLNEVAFAARPMADTATGWGNVYVTTTAGGTPRLVLAVGDAVGNDGTTFAGIVDSSLNSFQMNDRGQISMWAGLKRGDTTFEGVIRLDPDAGASAGNPLLPQPGAPAAPPPVVTSPVTTPVVALPGWGIVVPARPTNPSVARPRTWIDPDYAIGYVYTIDGAGPSFESILIPTPLPGGDESFSLHFSGQTHVLHAGQVFNFTEYASGGVAQFVLLGIDVAEQIDPQDAQGFVAGLTFAGDVDTTFTVQMNPLVVAVPEPAAPWLLLAGLPWVAWCAARRRLARSGVA